MYLLCAGISQKEEAEKQEGEKDREEGKQPPCIKCFLCLGQVLNAFLAEKNKNKNHRTP